MVEGIQEPIAPVNHSRSSAATSTAAGAGVGAVKGGVKWGARWVGIMAVAGGVVAAAFSGGFSLIATPLVNAILLGAGIGGVLGLASSPVAGGFGALFGGAKGAREANQRVKMEKATAQAMDMQLEAYKYNALAQAAQAGQNTTVYAPTAYNSMPPQGSAMNQAMPQIGGGVQYDGSLSGQQLQRA